MSTCKCFTITIDTPWTDALGRRHETMVGRPVAFHAMRGISAHSNGFHAIRTLSILMSLLGTIDPGQRLTYYQKAVDINGCLPAQRRLTSQR